MKTLLDMFLIFSILNSSAKFIYSVYLQIPKQFIPKLLSQMAMTGVGM